MSGNYQRDNAVMTRMQTMCEESLCPDHFEMWETIKAALFETRNSLKAETVPPEVGMYAVFDPTYPQIKVGDFTLCRQGIESVWIQHNDAEGAEFSDTIFEPVISEFYRKHF